MERKAMLKDAAVVGNWAGNVRRGNEMSAKLRRKTVVPSICFSIAPRLLPATLTRSTPALMSHYGPGLNACSGCFN